ncbi:MAG: SRPBCC domain-containing protein [Methanoculleus sp.]|nr:SRPBCC domain-containing protein [Methanoculleus sp.]
MDRMAQELQKSKEPAAGRGTIEGGQALAEKNPTRIAADPGKQELFVVREFDAPRELVFRAHTDPELFKQWIGPRGLSTRIETFEARNGGRWRYVQTDEEGNEYGFHGVNHDLTPPEQIIQTFEYEGLPESGHVIPRWRSSRNCPANRRNLPAIRSSSRLKTATG